MVKKSIAGVSLGLVAILITWLPMQAQEQDAPEPLSAPAPEPKADHEEEASGKVSQETLNDLLKRRDDAHRELKLMEAQLAVKQAEAQMAEAAVQVFLVQHPGSYDPESAVEKAIKSDPEVVRLRSQIETARNRQTQVAQLSRHLADPAHVKARKEVLGLEAKLRGRIQSLRHASTLEKKPIQSLGAPLAGGTSIEIERKLDLLIEGIEDLKRVLEKESRRP